ncbi:hypothetical protein SMICM304S_01312 [Streptomyces microflavus]
MLRAGVLVIVVPFVDLWCTGRGGTQAIRVVVVDDEPLVRSGLRAILGSAADIGVVADCGGGTRRERSRATGRTCCCWTSGCPTSTA